MADRDGKTVTVRTAGDHAGWNVYRAGYDRLRDVLHNAVMDAVETNPDAGDGIGSLGWRTGAALNSLLAAHPVDQRGRCRSCWGPGLWRRRRVCMVFQQAHYWLRQPIDQLPGHLVGKLEGNDHGESPSLLLTGGRGGPR